MGEGQLNRKETSPRMDHRLRSTSFQEQRKSLKDGERGRSQAKDGERGQMCMASHSGRSQGSLVRELGSTSSFSSLGL